MKTKQQVLEFAQKLQKEMINEEGIFGIDSYKPLRPTSGGFWTVTVSYITFTPNTEVKTNHRATWWHYGNQSEANETSSKKELLAFVTALGLTHMWDMFAEDDVLEEPRYEK